MSDSRIVYGARPPVVVRQHSPNDSFQLEALKMLLKTGSKKAVGVTSANGDDTKERSVDDFRASSNCT